MKYWFLSILLLFNPGCSSITDTIPDAVVVEDETPSYDKGERNSGIISATDKGFIITPFFRDRYNGMIKIYGERFVPELKKDSGITGVGQFYEIDKQHMVYFLDMNQWRKAGL